MKTLGITLMLLLVCLVAIINNPSASKPQRDEVSTSFAMPKPRDLSREEAQLLKDLIARRFSAKAVTDLKYSAAGPFRFAGNKQFLYIDRRDLGSVALEDANYGAANLTLDSKRLSKSVLLSAVERSLKGTDLDAPNRVFAEFQDEVVGAVQPRTIGANFDPREHSKLVARTVNFARVENGVPFFGSEFLIGLNPDGTIGRFRKHWPEVPRSVVDQAAELQRMVKSGKWQTPSEFSGEGYTILEVTAGVGHSTFSDPGLRVAPVVRVLSRRTAKGTEYPLSSASYRFYDREGKEVVFTRFPELPATAERYKKK